MFVDIADVKIAVFHLPFSAGLYDRVSSFKLKDLRYVHLSDLQSDFYERDLRSGVQEITCGFEAYLDSKLPAEDFSPLHATSYLNNKLSYAALERAS